MRDIEIFPPDRLAGACAKLKCWAGWVAAAVFAGVLVCAVGVVWRFQWLCVGGLISGCWTAYYLLDTRLRPWMAEKAFISHMLAVQPGKMDVCWGSVAPERVYVEGVHAREIRCRKDGAVRTFYLRAEDAVPPIDEGTPVRIESVDRFIVRIVPAE